MKKPKVLVTGAAGFIGSHLCEALIKKDFRVRAFVHYNSQHSIGNLRFLARRFRSGLELFFGDIQDPGSVKEAVKGCEVVFHLAALISIPYSYQAAASFFNTNVLGTLNVFQACRESGIQKILHTSTSEVYGTARYAPIDENHPLQGQSPYSASKIGADKIAESFFLSFDLPVVVVRPFNTYGPRQSERAVLPTIILQILKGKKVLELGSLEPQRDFNYVLDTVRGFLLAAENDGIIGTEINIGSGRCYSIKQTLEIIQDILGTKLRIRVSRNRKRPPKSEVMKLQCDYSRANKLLGYHPEWAFRKGLKETIAFYRKYLAEFEGDSYAI